jgi:large subunit ribosomal protein L6
MERTPISRIGRQPIAIPPGVAVEMPDPRHVRVKGPKGELALALLPDIDVEIQGAAATVSTQSSARTARAFHGLTRALLQNMVLGVSKGYEKSLEIVGVGWNAAVQGRKVVLSIGFCKPMIVELPAGVNAATPSPTTINVWGPDKQLVGQIAAQIRSIRPPEPYKGKGVRYKGEYVRQKAGKSFGS